MRVISDTDVNKVIDSLDHSGLEQLQLALYKALAGYNDDPSRIPERIVVNRSDLDAVHIFMPSFAKRVGIKTLGGSKEGFKGSVSILSETNGELLAVLNAFTLTAFRTALASSIGLKKTIDTSSTGQEITAYGNGLQSYWHVKLTLLLYPSLFDKVQLSVRGLNEKSEELFNGLKAEFPNVEFKLVTHQETDLSNSDVIYGCIPSTEPSIKYQNLNKSKPVFISLIGSYKPHMFECDDETVQSALENGKIIIDSKEHTLHEAGELIKNGVVPENCIELGELDKYQVKDITKSNLTLCKIVGLSIMDVAVGTEIYQRAESSGFGTELDF